MRALPDIGEWYRIRGGELLEVVAIDEDDGTIEVQYFDGTVEELDLADWQAQRTKGEIEDAEAPEDWSGSSTSKAMRTRSSLRPGSMAIRRWPADWTASICSNRPTSNRPTPRAEGL